jgi:spore coat polysaccharide biosynthesis protein SpsF
MSAIRIFVQARMSSLRFPGKMLAALAGRPLVEHVLERCGKAFGHEQVVLATSTDASDDALAGHARNLGYSVFRGELDNVLARFQRCLATHPCEWFVRVSGDSPLIDPALIARVAERRTRQYDLVTNVQMRTFPPGQSVEVVRAERFARIEPAKLAADEREHVTLAYYRRAGEFRILSVLSRDPALASRRMVVDTPEDLRAIEALLAAQHIPSFAEAIAA